MTPPASSPERRFAPIVFVIGKGGVGKTTVAAGLADWTVKSGRGATFVEFVDGESGRRALGPKSRVHHVVVEPQEAMSKMAAELFRSKVLAKVVTGNFAVKRMLTAAPALRELAQLDAVRRVAEERPDHYVFVDMPATGHGVAWLRAPKQMSALLSSGPLHGVAERLDAEILGSPSTSVVIVSLPERLVLEETKELLSVLKKEVAAPVRRLVINRVPTDLGKPARREAERLAQETPSSDRTVAAAALAEVLRAREAARSEAEETLRSALGDKSLGVDNEAILLPRFPVDPTAQEIGALLGPGFLDQPPFREGSA